MSTSYAYLRPSTPLTEKALIHATYSSSLSILPQTQDSASTIPPKLLFPRSVMTSLLLNAVIQSCIPYFKSTWFEFNSTSSCYLTNLSSIGHLASNATLASWFLSTTTYYCLPSCVGSSPSPNFIMLE